MLTDNISTVLFFVAGALRVDSTVASNRQESTHVLRLYAEAN